MGQSQPQRFDRAQVHRIPTLIVSLSNTGFHSGFHTDRATSAFNHLHNGNLIVELAAMRRLWGCLMLGTTSNNVAQFLGKMHNRFLAL